MNNWYIVYTAKLYTEAAIIKGKLERNDIPVQLLNRQDTMYNIAIGDYELYVPVHLKELALSLINDTLKN